MQSVQGGGVRTAMSIAIRDGVLCAFMPPEERLEDYLEGAAVEATAEEMACRCPSRATRRRTIRASR